MFGGHFYHASIRRLVSVFGTMFNDINIVRKDQAGNVKSMVRVPLAYGPKEKFLARIDEEPVLNQNSVAIKLPRMSFEIVSINYDTQSKLNRNNRVTGENGSFYMFAPYIISINLSIMTKNQDDALQVLEQILPYFQPEYTVTIKEGADNSLKTDVPITISSIDMAEDYEGDFMTRRAIIYTISFDAKVRFYGPDRSSEFGDGSLIKKVIVNTRGSFNTNSGGEEYTATVDPLSANKDDEYIVIEEIDYFGASDPE